MSNSSLILTEEIPWRRLKVAAVTSLTLLRLALTPIIFIGLYNARYGEAIFELLVAEATDVLDGRLARHWGVTTSLGASLDTWADKVLHVSLLFFFLVWPRPDLPHYFLFRDWFRWLGEFIVRHAEILAGVVVFTLVLAIELMLAFSRVDWFKTLWANLPFLNNRWRIIKDKRAKPAGKRKTVFHAICLECYILGAYLGASAFGETYLHEAKLSVTVAQLALLASLVYAKRSLKSRYVPSSESA